MGKTFQIQMFWCILYKEHRKKKIFSKVNSTVNFRIKLSLRFKQNFVHLDSVKKLQLSLVSRVHVQDSWGPSVSAHPELKREPTAQTASLRGLLASRSLSISLNEAAGSDVARIPAHSYSLHLASYIFANLLRSNKVLIHCNCPVTLLSAPAETQLTRQQARIQTRL